jgi:hypothetical protein
VADDEGRGAGEGGGCRGAHDDGKDGPAQRAVQAPQGDGPGPARPGPAHGRGVQHLLRRVLDGEREDQVGEQPAPRHLPVAREQAVHAEPGLQALEGQLDSLNANDKSGPPRRLAWWA